MDDYNDFFSQSTANSTTPKDNDLSKPQSEGTPAPDHSTTPVSVGPIPATTGGRYMYTTDGTTEETDEQISSKACVHKLMAWEYFCFGVLMLWL